MKPIENLIDKSVTPNEKPEGIKEGELWATHSGIVDIGGVKLLCHVLSDGQRVFDKTDVDNFFNGLIDQP